MRNGRTLPSCRMPALRHRISCPSGSRLPPLAEIVHPEAEPPQPLGVCPQAVRGGAVVYEASAGQEPPPAPDVVPAVFGIDKGHKLQVGAVPEGHEGIARQAVDVLPARRHPEPEAPVVPDGRFQVMDEYH